MKKTPLGNRLLATFVLAFLLALLATCAASAGPPLPGAIFTTLEDGTRVNANLFEDKCDVYLDGGPGANAPAGAAGLPDGDYYFQVTDPSGKTLLSMDPVESRQFEVADGVIIGTSGSGNHLTGEDMDHDAVTIQLCPYDDTPNRGGIYKVWVTPVADFVGDLSQVDNACGRGCFHGFLPAASKTDNFTVGGRGRLACLTIVKFYDVNENGTWDQSEGEVYGWPIEVYDRCGLQINGTLYTPFTLCQLVPGRYRVTEGETDDPALRCNVTANILDGRLLRSPEHTVLVRIRRADRELIFGNTCAGAD